SGTVVPQPGFVRAGFVRNPSTRSEVETKSSANLTARVAAETPAKPSNMTTAPTTVHNARGVQGSVPAVKIIGEPFAVPAGRSTALIPINTAYWDASTINLPANTTIVIQPNIRYLVLIANSINVASSANVV